MRSLVVVLGGAAGAVARWGVGLAVHAAPGAFPWATLTVNVSGAFALGLVATLLAERLPPTRYLRPLVGIGFIGAYTTFSTMAVEGVRLATSGRVVAAGVYWLATLVAGQAAGVGGIWTGRIRVTKEAGPI